MIPTQAWILHTRDPRSLLYRQHTAASCVSVNLPYRYVKGWEPWSHQDLDDFSLDSRNDSTVNQQRMWQHLRVMLGFAPDEMICHHDMILGGAACSASHYMMWHRVVTENQCVVILEHDALLLQDPRIEVPDNALVCLGYKLFDPGRYDHHSAGPPRQIVPVRRVAGSHAYVLTPATARSLLDDLRVNGIRECIDNYFFVRDKPGNECVIPIAMMDPTPAIAWLRESTIWQDSCEQNFEILPSFQAHIIS